MKRTLLAALAAGLLALTGYSQVETNLPPIAGNTNFWPALWGTLTTGSNYIIAPHYLYSIDNHRSGGGIAILAKMSDTVWTGVGLDCMGKDEIWMPSATLQINAPVFTLGKIKTTFFAYTGITTPLNAGSDNWSAIAIAGTGVNFTIYKKFGAFAAWEYRTGNFGQFIRTGLDISF